MQERIKELAREAGLERYNDESVDPVNFEVAPDGMWVLWDDDAMARFAQAVARECCQVVDVHPYWLGPTAKRELTDAIRARFGLGE